jgi:hypothetical protein
MSLFDSTEGQGELPERGPQPPDGAGLFERTHEVVRGDVLDPEYVWWAEAEQSWADRQYEAIITKLNAEPEPAPLDPDTELKNLHGRMVREEQTIGSRSIIKAFEWTRGVGEKILDAAGRGQDRLAEGAWSMTERVKDTGAVLAKRLLERSDLVRGTVHTGRRALAGTLEGLADRLQGASDWLSGEADRLDKHQRGAAWVRRNEWWLNPVSKTSRWWGPLGSAGRRAEEVRHAAITEERLRPLTKPATQFARRLAGGLGRIAALALLGIPGRPRFG